MVRKAEKEKKTAVRKKATEKAIKKKNLKNRLPSRKDSAIPHRTIEKIEREVKGFTSTQEYGVAVAAKKLFLPNMARTGITLMTVDPWKLFAYWEVKEDTLSKIKGTLVLRVYDVTGIYFDGKMLIWFLTFLFTEEQETAILAWGLTRHLSLT